MLCRVAGGEGAFCAKPNQPCTGVYTRLYLEMLEWHSVQASCDSAKRRLRQVCQERLGLPAAVKRAFCVVLPCALTCRLTTTPCSKAGAERSLSRQDRLGTHTRAQKQSRLRGGMLTKRSRFVVQGDNSCCFGHGNITSLGCDCAYGYGPESIADPGALYATSFGNRSFQPPAFLPSEFNFNAPSNCKLSC